LEGFVEKMFVRIALTFTGWYFQSKTSTVKVQSGKGLVLKFFNYIKVAFFGAILGYPLLPPIS